MNFRSRPRFIVGPPAGYVLPRLIKVNTRSITYFAEVVFAMGPDEEGVPGPGTSTFLFKRPWRLTLWNDWTFELHRLEDSGEWTQVTPIDHPLFVSTDEERPLNVVPEGSRHPSLAFDQSARVTIAYEISPAIKVTRWDIPTQRYVQNVHFVGADPVLINDAEVMYRVPDSDVVLFYLGEGRKDILYRLQRDVYGVPYTARTFLSEVSIDQAVALPYRLELVMGGGNGSGTYPLLSGLYPIDLYDFVGAAGEFSSGLLELKVFPFDATERLAAVGEYFNGLLKITVKPSEAYERIDASGEFGPGTSTGETTGGALTTVVYPQEALERITGSHELIQGALKQPAFPYELREAITGTGEFIGGTLS